MIAWLHLLPLAPLPGVIVFIAGCLPTLHLEQIGYIGGGPVRQWCFNHLAVPVLPNADAHVLVDWWMQASLAGELALHGLVAVNVAAIALPPLYLVGLALVHGSAWIHTTLLRQQRTQAQ
jgi:hypothetical protein